MASILCKMCHGGLDVPMEIKGLGMASILYKMCHVVSRCAYGDERVVWLAYCVRCAMWCLDVPMEIKG